MRETAVKITDNRVAVTKKNIQLGDYYLHANKDLYIVSRMSESKFALIDVYTGTSYLTCDELSQKLFYGNEKDFVKINKVTVSISD